MGCEIQRLDHSQDIPGGDAPPTASPRSDDDFHQNGALLPGLALLIAAGFGRQ